MGSSHDEKNKGGLEDKRCLLAKPQQYGFQRVCLVKSHSGQVVNVQYLSPVNKEGRRKTISTRNMVGEAIRNFEQLQQANFCFKQVKYNLPPEFEVEKLHTKPNEFSPLPLASPGRSIYNTYLIEKPSGVGRSRLAQCKLCGVDIRRSSFSRHMKRFHLPDQTCSSCGLDIRPDMFPTHIVKCLHDGKSNTKQVPARVESCRNGDAKMTFSNTDETSLRNDVVLSNTLNVMGRKDGLEDKKVCNDVKKTWIEDKVEMVGKARVIVKLVTAESPSKSLTVLSRPETKFKKILQKIMKKMKLTHMKGLKCRQGDQELNGEEMVKDLSMEPVMVEMKK